ncbi:MAG: hypothetical protein UZ17_ACD001002013 [Acidobacteria bacterium OLB17]|nr:MAG: hypothetical protein UZ17_ACD001002013 [Acidobacteria bacterium OLB17]
MPFFDAEGLVLPEEVRPRAACKLCDRSTDAAEEVICTLRRIAQRDEPVFKCTAFVSIYGILNDDIIK